MNHYGISEDEARAKRQGHEWLGHWRKPHFISLNNSATGAIVIASVPSGKGNDLMMGSRLEIWLFPDGTCQANISPQWLMNPHREGRIGKAAYETGCYLHPSCEECPEPDCVAKDYKLVQRSQAEH